LEKTVCCMALIFLRSMLTHPAGLVLTGLFELIHTLPMLQLVLAAKEYCGRMANDLLELSRQHHETSQKRCGQH
jgi:hypothetical protein